MATYNVQRSKHATLGAGTVDTVNFAMAGRTLRVKNRAAAVGDIYFTVDGQTDPVSLADDTYFAAFGENVVLDDPGRIVQIRLISADATPYSVELY